MKLNNLSRLTALLLALMMLPLAVFAESGTSTGDLTGDKLAQYNAATEMIADNKCSLCAETLANRDILEWPVENFDCLHDYLASLTVNEICQLLYDLDRGTSAEYALGQTYINVHNAHVDDTTEELHRDAVICYGLSCYKNPPMNPGPSHAEGCPWKQDTEYVPTDKTTVTDKNGTGITVTGDIPEGVKLTVDEQEPNFDALTVMVNLTDFAQVTGVWAYDITPMQGDTKWQPADGTTVAVTIPNVYDPEMAEPVVQVYHLLTEAENVTADSGYAKLTNAENGGVTLNADGSVTFEADGFSKFYVVAGTSDTNNYDTDVAEIPSENSTYYVEPGTTIIFERALTGNATSSILHPSNDTIEVAITAQEGDTASFTATYYYGFLNLQSRQVTITFEVSKRQSIITNAIANYPVYLSIKIDDGLPSEPGVTNGTWIRLNNNYTPNSGFTWSGYVFSNSAESIISPTIINALTTDSNGTSTIGLYDASGEECKKYILEGGINWDEMKEVALDQGAYASDETQPGINSNADDYIVVPYVIKLMAEKGYGWHIDCMLVPKTSITLSYDLNLNNFTTDTSLTLPNSVTDTNTINASVGYITASGSGDMDVGDKVGASLAGDSETDYELEFCGWSTNPNALPTDALIEPGDDISVTESTVLYAIWDSSAKLGSLRITKTATGLPEDHANHDFAFTVTYSPEGGTPRTWYFDLISGEEYILNNLLPGEYVVTETTSEVENNKAIVSVENEDGDTSIVTPALDGSYSYTVTVVEFTEAQVHFVNAYSTTVATLTITKTGMQSGESAIVQVDVGGDVYTLVFTDNVSQIIEGITIGTPYSATELNWSWQYDADDDFPKISYSDTDQKIKGDGSSTITITNKYEGDKWLHNETSKVNTFTANPAATTNQEEASNP